MATTEAEFEERHKFLNSKGGQELFGSIGKSVSVFQWGDIDKSHSNGSMFFTRTPIGIFGVTAKHVYEAYMERIAEGPVLCQIDNLRFDPIQRFVSAGTDCDIATFRITDAELKELGANTVPWPPLMPQVGHSVLLAGVPAIEKRFPQSGHVDFGKYTAMAAVSSLSETEISIQVLSNENLMDILGKGLPPRHYFMGGMSGGPLATITEGSRILSWQLCGVIHASWQEFEIIKAARADFINDDGIVTS